MDSHNILYVLGTEVVTDAARHSSCAHRVRAFRTNMVNPGQLQNAVDLTRTTTAKVWNVCLEPHHRPNVALLQKLSRLTGLASQGLLLEWHPHS